MHGAGFLFAAALNQFATEQHPIAQTIADNEAAPWQDGTSTPTAPELLDDFAAAGEHDLAVPPCELVGAVVLLQIAGYLATAEGGAEGGEIMSLVFDDADFDLTLANCTSRCHLRISLTGILG